MVMIMMACYIAKARVTRRYAVIPPAGKNGQRVVRGLGVFFGGEGVLFEEGDDAEDEDRLAEEEHGAEGGADVGEDDGGDAGGGGDEVEAEDGGAAGHAAGDEPVAEVVGVADEGALAARDADDGDDDEVVE